MGMDTSLRLIIFFGSQPQSQLSYDDINSRTSIQQHIFYCILPNLYLDNCHVIIATTVVPTFGIKKLNFFVVIMLKF